MKIIYSSIILFVLVIVGMLTGCTSKPDVNGNEENNLTNREISENIEKIEIYHFHGTQQCYSCVTMGDYAEATINTYFADELKSGKIVFGHINGELMENRNLVIKYGATGSSLWVGTYTKDGQFSAEQNINVWYKINNKEDFMDYLKEVIEKKLAGE